MHRYKMLHAVTYDRSWIILGEAPAASATCLIKIANIQNVIKTYY